MEYYIITYGCQMNKSDSERLAAQLEKKGHQADSNLKEADLIVINVCSVRQSAVNRVYSKIEQIRLKNPKAKLVLTGCLLAKDKNKLKDQIDEIWPIVGLSIKPRRIIESIQRDEPEYKSAKEALVPIMTGCDNFCSYCVVPYTRGREYSRPAQEIVEEIKNLVNKNYQKIILLGQNVNSYQSELRIKNQESRIDFPKLLKMIDGISGEFKIKFLTSHPKDMSDQLIEAISQSEKISKEIHLPVQSGDDVILKKMNRTDHKMAVLDIINRSVSEDMGRIYINRARRDLHDLFTGRKTASDQEKEAAKAMLRGILEKAAADKKDQGPEGGDKGGPGDDVILL